MSPFSSSVSTTSLSPQHSPEPLKNITNSQISVEKHISSILDDSGSISSSGSNYSCGSNIVPPNDDNLRFPNNNCSIGSLQPRISPNKFNNDYEPLEYHNENTSFPVKILSDFNEEQIDCIAGVLIKARDMDGIDKFLKSMTNTKITSTNTSEIVLLAKCELSFAKGNFKEVYKILETSSFDAGHHTHLQDMWYKAHYKEAERVRQRGLGE